ncbi:MAG: hypothetical protein HY722_10780 [Planctomycetes bacterium]|nr:hypothetical protein [Planctomycetota bacterium]
MYWPLVPLVAGVIGGVFAAFGLAEHLWLPPGGDPRAVDHLHAARGISSGVLASTAVAVFVFRRHRTILVALASGFASAGGADGDETERLRGYSGWLVQARWVASALTLVLVLSGYLGGIVPAGHLVPLGALALAVAASNLFWARSAARTRRPYRAIVAQIGLDLVLLTLLLAWSGGLGNPLYVLYLLHVVGGAILLRPVDGYRVAALSGGLVLALAVVQAADRLPGGGGRIPPPGEGASGGLFLAALPAAFSGVMGALAFLAASLTARLRRTEAGALQAARLAAVGELAGQVAHEVNNPATIIFGKVSLLLSDPEVALPARVRQDLEKVQRQVGRITTITGGLLAYSRPPVGARRRVDLNAVARSALDLVGARGDVGRVRIDVLPDAPPVPVRANVHEMEQVVLNLLSNALDAMPEGGTLRVRTGHEGNGATLSVSDTGSGIAPEHLPRVFEPFFTTKPEGKGTGLGLAVVAGLVRGHGGSVRVESRPGEGTTFHVELPVDAGGEAA